MDPFIIVFILINFDLRYIINQAKGKGHNWQLMSTELTILSFNSTGEMAYFIQIYFFTVYEIKAKHVAKAHLHVQ